MSDFDDDDESSEDIFANLVFHFLRQLEILAETPEKQCEILWYDNVGWELKNFFIRNANSVLNTEAGRLSPEQVRSISELLEAVTSVPGSVINVLNHKEDHLRAMSNPCWQPIRVQARKLLFELAPLKRRAYITLGINSDLDN